VKHAFAGYETGTSLNRSTRLGGLNVDTLVLAAGIYIGGGVVLIILIILLLVLFFR
jgi:hypothetical protein